MEKCIYCLRELPKSKFNREHVIPVAFGKFDNNLVLHHTVCKECNQYFGDNLELILGRGSLEAIFRIEEDVISPESAKAFIKEKISLTISSTNHLDGLHVWFRGPGIEPLPQVRFRSKDPSRFIYIKLADLLNPKYEISSDANTTDFAILVKDIKTKQEIIKALETRGISFVEAYEEWMTERGGEIAEIEIATVVDDLVFRSVAKIALNYLTNVAGADFALSSEFDELREFIRYGTLPKQALVSVIQDPILFYDKPNLRKTNGHLIVIDWDYRSHVIISKVSLFNNSTYQIILSRNCSGLVFRSIKSGHQFNITSKRVNLLSSRKIR